jgi:hypothetical protein
MAVRDRTYTARIGILYIRGVEVNRVLSSPVGVLKAGCRPRNENETSDSLLFPDAVEELVKSIGHHHVHTDEIVDGSEAAHREVPLDEVALASKHTRSLT